MIVHFESQQIYSYVCKLSQTSSKLSSEQSIDVHVHCIYKVYRSTMYLKLSLLKSLHFVGVIHSYRSILSLWPLCNILIIMSDTFMHHSSMSSKNFHFYFISYDCSKINWIYLIVSLILWLYMYMKIYENCSTNYSIVLSMKHFINFISCILMLVCLYSMWQN